MILDPIDPYGMGRWDRGLVTKEALCRADPDLWGVWVGDHPDLPGGTEIWNRFLTPLFPWNRFLTPLFPFVSLPI
jgi:hypothetical protein